MQTVIFFIFQAAGPHYLFYAFILVITMDGGHMVLCGCSSVSLVYRLQGISSYVAQMLIQE